MTTSSFLFVVRVPVEDGNDANDKETKDKKDDRPGDKDIPLKQDAVLKESGSTNEGTTKSTDTQTIGKKDQVQSASLSKSSDVDNDSTAPVKPEENGAILDNAPITTSQTPLSESSSVKAIDISSTPSDPQTSPLPLNTPQESSDPSQNVMYETIDPSIDRDMETPPPWDFTPPSTPSSTSTSAQQDTDVVESTDPQNQEPEKTKPPPAWTFPTFGKSKKESDVQSVKNTESQESDSVAKPTDVAQLPEISVDHQPPSSPDPNPSSNETSSSDPLPADKRADKTVDEKQDQDDAKPVDIEEKTQQSSDDSTDKFPPESKDKPVEPASEKDKDKDKDFEIFVKTESLFQRTMSVLESYAVKNLCVHKTANGKYFQFMFVEEGENCEEILNKLAEIGIGDNTQSSISLFETSIYKGTGGVLDMEEEEEELFDSAPSSNSYEQKKSEFKKSIKARMLVTEVVNSVQGNAEFTFDFLLLVILASSISAMGLVENSSVVLVASMLVSPIMGPILAGTFGTVIQNNTLRNLGIKNELRSLLICVAMGMVWGLVCGGVCKDGAFWGSTDSWPTSEMKSRGMTRSLWTGVLIALPSGAGVALSILGGNTGSLVGVAISASLLPPAVNAGMLWASAIIASIAPPPRVQTITSPVTTTPTVLNYTVENTTQTTSTVVSELTTSPTLTPTLNCLPLVSNAYVPVYSCDMAEEMLYLGLFSLLLTILNIICIIIMGIIVLKIKEVAPQVALSEETKTFWSEDIKIAKASYVTMKGNQSKNLSQQARELLNEWRKDNGDEPIQLLQLERLTQEIDDDPRVKDIQMRIPGGMRGDLVSRHFADEINKDEEKFEVIHHQYKTFHALQNLHGHSRRNLFHTNFYNGYYPSPSTSTGSMRRKKEVSTSLTEVNEKNVPFSADGPIKPAKSPGHFSKAFGILRNPRAGRSNLFRRRANNSKPEEKQIRFAVEKVPDTEVKVQIMKDADNQSVSQPLLIKQESV